MMPVGNARPGSAADWTKDRINLLTTPEVKQLRVNAERLSEQGITTLCDQVLTERRRKTRSTARKP
jgi:hypothetical protein